MLHEVLLALSGHPSPLFEDAEAVSTSPDFPLLTASERALLESIGRLSSLHRKLRQHIDAIALQHDSIICRAAATSIKQRHLARFQDKIIDVESHILKEDISIVGAYEIVPLSAVVSEFDVWQRCMTWYWDLACYIQDRNDSKMCSGAALIDRLRIEQQSGFPDIEAIAIELSKTAESVWLRQVASWVIYVLAHLTECASSEAETFSANAYRSLAGLLLMFLSELLGKLPGIGAADFFVQTGVVEGAGDILTKDKDKLPKFVLPTTASSIVFIGKSLRQAREYGTSTNVSSTCEAMSQGELASLRLPIVAPQLSRAILAIRTSVSQNVLRYLLPQDTTLELLSCLKDFFLLGNSEFAAGLISEAQHRVQMRREANRLQQDTAKALQGLPIKDAELQQTLSSTWKAMASLDEHFQDQSLDFSRNHISLAAVERADSRPTTSDSVHGATADVSDVAFNDLLFPGATTLRLKITPPLDLLMSKREVDIYSAINSYLLAIKRAQLRLSNLWRHTSARRDYPMPAIAYAKGLTAEAAAPNRLTKRRVATRKAWATSSAAIFLVSETLAYFEGEIITESWNHFIKWVQTPVSSEHAEDTQISASTTEDCVVQQDPETLASGHRVFLPALTYGLLLNDVLFTKGMRSLLGNIDDLIAFFGRLLDTQQKLDTLLEGGGETTYTMEEERRYSLELDRARKKVDSDLKSVVNRLRSLDQERIGSARYSRGQAHDIDFEPWQGSGVDRLLMKLEFCRPA